MMLKANRLLITLSSALLIAAPADAQLSAPREAAQIVIGPFALYAARFNLSASRFKPFIGVERVRARARRGPEIDARSRRIDRAVTAGLAFELSPRTALTTSVRLDEANYEEGQRFRGTALDDALNRTEIGRASCR